MKNIGGKAAMGRANHSVNVCDCYLYSYCLGYQYKRHGDGARRGR